MNRLPHWNGPQAEASRLPVPFHGRLPLPTRVGRAIRPGRPGTINLQRQFGPALQAVRYRYDATGLYRFITVELLVDQAPVTRGRSLDTLFAVRVGVQEMALRRLLLEHGARWNPQLRRWILDGRTVQVLNLIHRVDLKAKVPPTEAARPQRGTHRHR